MFWTIARPCVSSITLPLRISSINAVTSPMLSAAGIVALKVKVNA